MEVDFQLAKFKNVFVRQEKKIKEKTTNYRSVVFKLMPGRRARGGKYFDIIW